MALAKGLLRVQPLVSVTTSSTGVMVGTTGVMSATFTGEVFSISTGPSTRLAYAGLHLLSSADGVAWTFIIQSATACAFATPTTRFTFTAQTCSGAQILTPIAQPGAGSTDIQFYRVQGTPASTTDYRLGTIWVAFA